MVGTLLSGFADFPRFAPCGHPRIRLRFQRLLTYVLILSMALPLPGQFGPPKPPVGAASSSWGITIFPFTLVLIPLMIAWAADYSSRPTDIPPERRRGTDPVLIAILCMVGAATVSVLATHADWRHASMWLWLFGLFAFARYRMPRIIGRSQLAIALCWVMAALALVSAAQFVTGRPVGAVATFFQHQVRSAQVYSGKGGGGLLKRVQGTFFSTDVFAMFLLYVVLWLVGVTRTVKNRFVVLTMLGSGLLIAATFSRGVWGATLVTVGLIMIVFIRRRQLAFKRLVAVGVVLVVAVAIAAVLAAGTIFARLSSSQVASSAQTRDTATKVGICLIQHRPVFGVGYGASVVRQNIGNCNPNANDIRSHNIYVQVWAEQGIFALVAYLSIGFMMLWEALRRRRVDDPGNRAMRTAVAFSVLAWLLFMIFYATANDFNVMPIWILLGGYSLTLLDTSRKIIEPLGGPAPLDLAPRAPRELAPV
jgi:O-antigen ligase